MGKFSIAKQLAGRRLVTNDGEEIGKLVDIMISEVNGKMESLLIEPNLDNPTARRLKKDDGMIIVPYKAVLAASDFIIVDRRALGV
ncbi:PRC-barrel domain protein [Candidatus Gugararchaeum adminiculabundum]|nr:PRC-barrel domain protein [Candidatus Gugararchaeum adminiculabundum]